MNMMSRLAAWGQKTTERHAGTAFALAGDGQPYRGVINQHTLGSKLASGGMLMEADAIVVASRDQWPATRPPQPGGRLTCEGRVYTITDILLDDASFTFVLKTAGQ
jgi:hypothetical protein